jgi:hypothetical protein
MIDDNISLRIPKELKESKIWLKAEHKKIEMFFVISYM